MNLEELAKLATEAIDDKEGWYLLPELLAADSGIHGDDADYIAAASPDVVLALVRVAQAAAAFDDTDLGDADPGLRGELGDALAFFDG